jgi:hypothetical protein
VPTPIILGHISQCGIDTSLCGYGMRSSGEQFGHTGRFESSFGESHGGSKSCSTGSYDDGIIFMIDYGVVSFQVKICRETTIVMDSLKVVLDSGCSARGNTSDAAEFGAKH